MTPEPIGKTVAGCEITELIGEGGMGIVYKAHHIALDQDRAIKVMDPFIAKDKIFVKRFQEEGGALARLHSPYIVTVYDLCETEIGTCLIMEYVKGQTLSDIISSSTRMDERRMFRLFKQILMALEHAHGANVIHRDIKPRNILVSEGDVVKVADFGLAKVQRHDSTTVTQLTGGTIYYMSPEQVEGLGKVDHRGDLYSLGMTLYEALTGAVPFEKTESDFSIRERIVKGKIAHLKLRDPRLNTFVAKALERDPADRFQTAAEMRAELERIEIDLGEKRIPWPRFALVGAGVLTVGVAGYVTYRLLNPEPSVRPGDSSHLVLKPKTEQIQATVPDTHAISPPSGKTIQRTPRTPRTIVSTSLNIVSNPPRATIYIDGILREGGPPYKVTPGDHTVRVVSRKNNWEKKVSVAVGKEETVTVDFNKQVRVKVVVNFKDASGAIDTTRSISSCWVLVDGDEVASITPSMLQLPIGTHTITVRHPVRGEPPAIRHMFEADTLLRFVLPQ